MFMLGFLRFSVIYFCFAIAFSMSVRDGETLQVFGAVRQLGLVVRTNLIGVTGLLSIVGVSYYLSGRNKAVMINAALAIAATGFFKSGFTTFKSSMPFAQDFYADHFLAKVDYFLHFGTDPWQIAHNLAPFINPHLAGLFYVKVWLVLALGFPLLLAVTESDHSRRLRFLVLYCVTWIGLGNVAALMGMSAGPIYYDNLYNEARFDGLRAALDSSGVSTSLTGWLHAYLWQNYATAQNVLGSGISAFPSVHVAMATVLGLYLAERFPRLTLISVIYVGSILFLSVYLGWHYAVDGYVSIAVIMATSAWLARRSARTEGLDVVSGLTHSTMVR